MAEKPDKKFPFADIIAADAAILSARAEGGGLRLWCIHSEREYLEILYEDVLYGQIGEGDEGLRISLVQELSFDGLSELRHNAGRNKMLHDIPDRYAEVLESVCEGKYRVFAHYSGRDERLVVARGVRVEGADERLAKHESEYRKYRLYAFITHEEGGTDAKWARWLERGLGRYRIPADTVLKPRDDGHRGSQTGESEPLPKRFRVARAGAEACAGNDALSNLARYLIVVCSPRGAKSERVERDTKDFLDNGKEDYVIPFIVAGEPAGPEESRCYPPSLSADVPGVSLFGGTREEVFFQIMARLLRVKFSSLYQRHLRERRRFLARALTAALAVLVLLSGLTCCAVSREIEAARRQAEAEGLAGFLADEMGNDLRLPEGVREMIGEHVRAYREYREKHNG
jgi:hypothetical protein